jgi:ABC-type amino acid transport substrate-binding protein
VAEDFGRRLCPPENIETFDLNVALYQALGAGRIDVVVDDRPIAACFARSEKGLSLGPVLAGTGYEYGIVLGKGNDSLRRAVNEALAEMRQNGTLDRLHRRWFADVESPGGSHPQWQSRPE